MKIRILRDNDWPSVGEILIGLCAGGVLAVLVISTLATAPNQKPMIGRVATAQEARFNKYHGVPVSAVRDNGKAVFVSPGLKAHGTLVADDRGPVIRKAMEEAVK